MASPTTPAIDDESLRGLVTRLNANALETLRAVDAKLQQWKEKETAWKALEERIQANIDAASNLVTLNVGGRRFTTSKETLLRVEGSYFHALLGCGHWRPEGPEDAFFLDLDPVAFDRIMIFLRQGELILDGLCDWERRQVYSAMDYLKLTTVIEAAQAPPAWSWNPLLTATGLGLGQDDLRLHASQLGGGWKAALGSKAVMSFTLKLDEFDVETCVIAIGFAPRQGFEIRGRFLDTCGYYWVLPRGILWGQDGTRNKMYSGGSSGGRHAVENCEGVEVSCRYSHGDIGFSINGVEFGAAFHVNLPTVELYPAVRLLGRAVISIVA
ncbi:hypothetical protein LEN26_007157 [Aphanomyces euteiches]|nr:hypothetical protein LEN26_007157 [Aphanomyces euteiches]